MGKLTRDKQKTMLKVGDKPILEHILEKLCNLDIEEIIIVVGYKKEKVKEYFKNKNFGVNIKFTENKITQTRKGTALSTLAVENSVDNLFLLLNGDILFDDNLEELLEMKTPCVCVTKVKDVSEFGKVYEKNGQLVKFNEKSDKGPGIINAGVYLLPTLIFDAIKKTEKSPLGSYDITDSIMISKRKFGIEYSTYNLKGRWIDIGTPEDLEKSRIMFE